MTFFVYKMASEQVIKGRITLKIERYSTLDYRYRFSEIVKIGKHSWCLAARFQQQDGVKYLSVFRHCNGFITESSWKTNGIWRAWLVHDSFKINTKSYTVQEFSCIRFGSLDTRFIAKDKIPESCIVNDTLTIQAEIEVTTEECPSVLFGSPSQGKLLRYKQVIQGHNSGNLFNSEVFSDVVFIIGPKELPRNQVKIFGHRAIIGLLSPVFVAMLFPQQAGYFTQKFDEKGRVIIEIHDPYTHPTAVLSLFRFIYKKEVVVDRHLIQETLYAAEKYDVKNFAESLGFLITPETVLDFVPFVFNVGTRHILYQRCNWIIFSQTKLLINMKSFLKIGNDVMEHILKSDYLQVRELDLFNAYVKWAHNECANLGITVNDRNVSKVMLHLDFIRFPIMTKEEFATGPALTGILSGDEKTSILCNMVSNIPTTFKCRLRNF